MSLPQLTIGVPTYNEEKSIAATINSILNQDYKNIKILIGDNHSTDRTYEILSKISLNDERITLFQHNKNIGPRANWIFLLEKAKTDYFIFIGGHDIISRTFLHEAVLKLESRPSVVAVYPITYMIKNATDQLENTWPMFDNFEVQENTIQNRVIKVIQNCKWGSAIHSVFRIGVLKSAFKNIEIDGGDLAFFLHVVTMGEFVQADSTSLYMSNVKLDETQEEVDKRYMGIGFSHNWKVVHSMYPYQIISQLKEYSYLTKIRTLSMARVAMFNCKSYSWKPIFIYFFRKWNFEVCFNVMFCKLYELMTRKKSKFD